ncbi:adenylate/guanylate cyclase domain-containing protein [Afifella pfennigii]|uniref:adenylate/guanylate cyclase domain-containing protein n=1 Tax=Afifella pfennigii TaxID=209897 RepID=UPI00068D03C7|nr:adenylate/guanylate cyclase domain-containing protein [Afifella pfennigii]
MERLATDPDFERRARLALVWEDLVNPVRGISGYQEIILEECRKLGVDELSFFFENVLKAATTLSTLVDGLRDPKPRASAADIRALADEEAKLRHDLRTPLNAIIGYTEMAVEDIDEFPEAVDLLPDIAKLLHEARQLLERVDTIVDLTRDGSAPEPVPGAEGEAVVAKLLNTLAPQESQARVREVGRVLVVDDNQSNRDLLSRRLRQDGHEVTSVASGMEALAVLQDEAFDLILLDLLMPGMNGLDVLLRLKANERWYQIPVIVVSGLNETGAVLKCIEAGADDYLPKPCDIVLLRARINACLERKRWREREQAYLVQISEEKAKSDRLLRNILPAAIVERLNEGETIIADRFDAVSILFADIVGFTPVAAAMTPARLVNRLDRIFSDFDLLAADLGVEKIKTIGDAYMAAAGLPEPRHDHVEAMAEFALGILEKLHKLNRDGGLELRVRIGIHTGPVVAGVIGRRKFIYDVWGDTVNVASRLEANGLPNRIQVSPEVREALAHRFSFEERGFITLKGKGRTTAFFLCR